MRWSSAATELFGFSADEAVGAKVDLIVPPDYRDRHWSGFHRVMNGGRHTSKVGRPTCQSDARMARSRRFRRDSW
ncbi:MAG: PAS domain S-box protein [Chloroflexi bacterium]|nr:PAS domain S-box protein [Chloroflexota bacterium]